MEKITVTKEYVNEPPEIRVIDPKRTSLVSVRMSAKPIRKKRNMAQSVILFLACAGSGFFAGIATAGAVLLYCLQAGPI